MCKPSTSFLIFFHTSVGSYGDLGQQGRKQGSSLVSEHKDLAVAPFSS